MKILVAEDNLAAQFMLKKVLGKLGHDLLITGDGCRACEIMLKKNAPKLAILDWVMPGMDGTEVCRKIRATEVSNSAYLILLTVRDTAADIVKGLKAGANDYIVKPYNIEELQVRVGVGCRVVEMQAIMTRQIHELQSAMEQVKTLRGLLPLCVYCKKIRNDQKYWQELEGYISDHTDASFSHGICPDCFAKYVQPDLEKKKAK